MSQRHSHEEVDSLFGHLQTVEEALAHNQEALLRAIDEPYAASALAALGEEGETLDYERARIIREIARRVAASTASSVFAPSGSAPARDDVQLPPADGVDIPL